MCYFHVKLCNLQQEVKFAAKITDASWTYLNITERFDSLPGELQCMEKNVKNENGQIVYYQNADGNLFVQ